MKLSPSDETRIRALIFGYLWDNTDFEGDELNDLADGLSDEVLMEFQEGE